MYFIKYIINLVQLIKDCTKIGQNVDIIYTRQHRRPPPYVLVNAIRINLIDRCFLYRFDFILYL